MGPIACRWVLLTVSLTARAGLAADPAPLFAPVDAIPLTALPASERAVTALVLREGIVYGLTTGLGGHLFAFDPRTHAVRDLYRLEGGVGFSFGIASDAEGLVAATQLDPTGLGRSPDPRAVGTILRWRPPLGGSPPEDRGAAVPGQAVYTLALSPKSGEAVGLTLPDGHFFAHEIKSGATRDLGPIAGHRQFEPDAPCQVARALAVAPDGAVYTSGKDGTLYRYDPLTRSLSALAVKLPCLLGRESWASLDAAAVTADGVVYGGTSDGYLFRFQPPSGPVVNLGKPIRGGGFHGLLLSASGLLYGVAGERGGMPREFSFDPRGGGFRLGGIPSVGGEADMEGFGVMITDGAGLVYAGEPDRIARLGMYRIQ